MLEPGHIPGILGQKAGFTPAHQRAHTETSIHTHIHSHEEVGAANYPNLHVGVPGETMQTSHKKGQGQN